ncbi:MAG: DsbA family protein [Proteobacteria bacterium]|nr:DsbA family protein [Pseudomonadota bacterium]
MNEKTPGSQAGRMHWVIVVGAVVVVVLVALTATVVIETEGPQPEAVADDARAAALASDGAPAMGDPDAPVHIVEFLDPACETCALFYPMVKQWMQEAPGKIRLSVRHVPFHRGAEHAVQVLEASRAQGKYWETLEALLSSQAQWTQNHRVLQDRVLPAVAGVGLDMDELRAHMNGMEVLVRMERDRKDALTLEVRATPEYYVNGRPLPSFGAQQLLDLVREELAKAEGGR